MAIAITLALTLINSLLLTRLFYKDGITNLPSPFVLTTYWFAMSCLPWQHDMWQAQLMVLGIGLTVLALLKTDFHHEATEESFLATLICCFLTPTLGTIILGIMLVWGYLIAQRQMTWRVWFASLIAIAIRVLVAGFLRYCGWLEWLRLENIPHLTGMQWAIFGGISLVAAMMMLLPLRKPSTASGTMYIVLVILLTVTDVLYHLEFLN